MDRHPSAEETLHALGEFAASAAEAQAPEAAFRAAERAAEQLIGHRLFTIMAFHAETMEVERCYSNDPLSYASGGRKQKRDTAWGRRVLQDGRHFIGRDANDIRRHFDDHGVILRLGLGSVLNVPIRCLGHTIGTMNLLDRPGHYDDAHVEAASLIALGLVGALRSRLAEAAVLPHYP